MAHLFYEILKSGAELAEGQEEAHKPGWESKVKGTLGLASGGLGVGGTVFGAGGALAMEAGALGAGGAMAGAGAMLSAGGALGGAGLAGFVAGSALDHWLGISDRMAGVTPGALDDYHALACGVHGRQEKRGQAGLAEHMKQHQPVAYYANEMQAQANRINAAHAMAADVMGNYAL